jgi:hypothetical protein
MDVQEHARAARTQSVFRLGNERLTHINETFSSILELGDWVCECANTGCSQRMQLTSAEYEAIRSNPRRFAVMPGEEHVFDGVERVIERTDRFWVVEKFGQAGELAALVDPRAQPTPG